MSATLKSESCPNCDSKDIDALRNMSKTVEDIRKVVIARKISGQHRSPLGVHSREIMMSTILTCPKRGINPFELVDQNISEYNFKLRGS